MLATSFLRVSLAAALPFTALAASGSGHSTRYWDCCKPSCAWSGKASVNQPVLTCDANDNPLTDFNTASGCDGGSAYMCSDQSPWQVTDVVSYGFAATAISGGSESSTCCACFAVTFTSGPVAGKTMVVQSTNTGSDLGSNQFDLAVPGGGQGIFSGCTTEFGSFPGAQYGGISDVSECASMPPNLQAGCDWRFNWFQNADNPDFTFEQVQCPAEIIAKSGCKRDDDSSFPVFSLSGSAISTSPATFAATSSAAVVSPSAPDASSSVSPVENVASSSAAPSVTPLTTSSAGQTPATASTTPTALTTSTSTSLPTESDATGPDCGSVAPHWGQCGGKTWQGCTSCESGYTCQEQNPWYSQCL